MAREEQDREDLLRDATALVERIELAPASGVADAEPVVVGFRRNGALSIFFGADPVYQFNAAGELRRAFRGGLLYKAERGRLVSLERARTPDEVQLLRRELSDEQQGAFLSQMQRCLADLARQLNGAALRVVGQLPPQVDVLARAQSWLSQHDGLPIAASSQA
jgi:hypothetical protein